MDTILQLLKAVFELLAGLFDPESGEQKNSNRKKSAVAAKKYVRLLLAFLVLAYLVSVVPLWLWGKNQGKRISGLEAKVKEVEAANGELKKSANDQFALGARRAWWELIRHESLACSDTFADDLANIQNDVDWPTPDGRSNEKTLESIRTHLLSLEKNLVFANKYHQWVNARTPANCQDLHKPILQALNTFRAKLMLQKGQVNGSTNLTLFKDDVCRSVEGLIEEVKKVIANGDLLFSKASGA